MKGQRTIRRVKGERGEGKGEKGTGQAFFSEEPILILINFSPVSALIHPESNTSIVWLS